MALIKCPDCSKDVSDTAPACPNCGRPIKAHTIEQTGKKWKQVYIVACVVVGAGLAMYFAGYELLGIILLVVGLLIGIGGEFGKWWEHG